MATIVQTIKGSGGTYTSIAAFEAGLPANLVTDGNSYVGALYTSGPGTNGEWTSTSLITFAGSTTDATHTITLRPATVAEAGSAQGFRDNANVLTNALRYNNANGVAIKGTNSYSYVFQITDNFVTFDGLQILSSNGDSTSGCINQQTGVSATCTLQNCILEGQSRLTSTTGDTGLVVWFGSGSIVQNNVIIVTAGNGDGLACQSNPKWYSNTIFSTNGSTGKGANAQYGIAEAKNNAVAGFTTDYRGTCTTSDKNATDKVSFGGTGWGTNGQVSLVPGTEWTNVTGGSQDLRVASGSVKLKGNGATVGPSDDIAKQTRTAPYTIGCWQFVAAVTTSAANLVGGMRGLVGGTLAG